MNPYHILGIKGTASLEEIKQAYKRLAKMYHPDKNPGNKIAEEKFKGITGAYEELIGKRDTEVFNNLTPENLHSPTGTGKIKFTDLL